MTNCGFDWAEVLAIIGANIALFTWLKSDMKSFEQEMRADMKSHSQEMREDMKTFSQEIRGWKDEIREETKDFHGRLCAIEERKKQTDP